MKNKLDNYIKICLSIISGSILLVILMIGSVLIFAIFFESSETNKVERRQEHV